MTTPFYYEGREPSGRERAAAESTQRAAAWLLLRRRRSRGRRLALLLHSRFAALRRRLIARRGRLALLLDARLRAAIYEPPPDRLPPKSANLPRTNDRIGPDRLAALEEIEQIGGQPSYAAELVVALFDRPQSYFQTRTSPLGGVQRSQPKHVALASLRIHPEARYFAPGLDGFLRGGVSTTCPDLPRCEWSGLLCRESRAHAAVAAQRTADRPTPDPRRRC